MKKLMMMLAVVACAASVWADASTVVYRIRVISEASATDSCLAPADLAAHDTKTTTGGSEPPIGGEYNYYIRKSGSPTAHNGTLANGYGVYLIQYDTAITPDKFTEVVNYMNGTSSWDFYKDNAVWKVDEKYGDPVSNLYYGYDGEKHLSIQFASYENGASATTIDPTKTIAIMTYENADHSEAQYVVSKTFSTEPDQWGNIFFVGTPYADGEYVDGSIWSTGWQSFGAIPEPTSGMLLLLGVAGLALKRKRA